MPTLQVPLIRQSDQSIQIKMYHSKLFHMFNNPSKLSKNQFKLSNNKHLVIIKNIKKLKKKKKKNML